jgi:hypothetical protein
MPGLLSHGRMSGRHPPDVPQWQPAPGPTLAFAAALADLRVGTWVSGSPLRPAWSTVWEAHSLSVLTDDVQPAGESVLQLVKRG